jgi:hypothetical protein
VEITVVVTTVLESELTLTFEHVLHEVALVGLLRLCEVVDTETGEHAVFKITFVVAAIGPLITTTTQLLPLDVLATKLDLAKLPSFFPKSMLQIVEPLSVTCTTLSVDDTTVAVGHVALPVTLIDIAVCLCHAASPAHFVVLKLTDVRRSVRPCQHTNSVHDLLPIDFAPKAVFNINITYHWPSYLLPGSSPTPPLQSYLMVIKYLRVDTFSLMIRLTSASVNIVVPVSSPSEVGLLNSAIN